MSSSNESNKNDGERKWIQSAAMKVETETDRRVSRKKFSKKHERQTAKRFGGKRQPGSGCLMDAKGDVVTEDVMFDDKATEQKSWSLTQASLAKLCDEARDMGKSIPVMKVLFKVPIEEMQWHPKEWVVMPSEVLEELMQPKKGTTK